MQASVPRQAPGHGPEVPPAARHDAPGAPLPGGFAGPSPLGLYVHVPFCASICSYCNFNRGLLDEALKRRYVDALVADIHRSAEAVEVDTIYFGGGTPSLLAAGELRRVIDACRRAFGVAPAAEVTLEANPETVDEATLSGLREAGVNRLSFGVQSFRDEELARLGRRHDAARARHAFADARRAGFDDISLDLMMWLPGQTAAQWRESVEALIALGPEHASLYLLELYPNAPLKEDMARAGWSQAPEDEGADMYLETMRRLERAGYAQYEISNVARDGRRSRHNLKYWQDGEWLAFGCGAHGRRRGERWRNVSATAEYIDRVGARRDVRAETLELTAGEAAAEAAFMGLRLVDGIDVAALGRRYGLDFGSRYLQQLSPARDAGLLVVDGARWRLTRQGMLLSTDILSVFV